MLCTVVGPLDSGTYMTVVMNTRDEDGFIGYGEAATYPWVSEDQEVTGVGPAGLAWWGHM